MQHNLFRSVQTNIQKNLQNSIWSTYLTTKTVYGSQKGLTWLKYYPLYPLLQDFQTEQKDGITCCKLCQKYPNKGLHVQNSCQKICTKKQGRMYKMQSLATACAKYSSTSILYKQCYGIKNKTIRQVYTGQPEEKKLFCFGWTLRMETEQKMYFGLKLQ